MTALTRKAPAKINLFLEITGRRPDGYHDIESVMQTVTLFDGITVTKTDCDGKRIKITCTNPDVPCDSTNLCWRAAERFFEAAEISGYDIAIHIDKHIPMAAGLGGGSSDAAATLFVLNELYGEIFTKEKLCALGARLGADVPFCIVQGISITKGIGDVFAPCSKIPDCHIVIACHGEGVSTPWAYRRLDEMYDFASRNVSADAFADIIAAGDLRAIAGGMTNIFESAVLPERPLAREIREILSASGALRAMMSGSGPSVVGIFDGAADARNACAKLTALGIVAHVCKPYYTDGK